jgi:hypothetical protein
MLHLFSIPECIMSTIRTSFLVLGFGAAVLWSGSATGQGAKPATPDARPNAESAPVSGKDNQADKPGKKHNGKWTITKETTYVTEPLDRDGYIDYPAALNERLRQGVTPANNANVLIWRALGPHPEGGTMSPEYFQWLGIPVPPENGTYFIDLFPYLKDHLNIDPNKNVDEISDQQIRSLQRPWTPKEYPNMDSWLKANEKPLALVVEATKRSYYFSPLVPTRTKKGSSGLIGALLPAVQKCRALANALAARAMLRVGQGDEEGAWQDLLTCHRLGRLVGRGGTLIEGLVGIAIDSIACRADLAYLDRAKPNAKRIESCLRDLQKLPPLPEIADKVNLTERFVFLEIVTMIDRHGIQYLESLSDPVPGGRSKGSNPLAELMLAGIDWDPALRNANRWYDRAAAVMRGKDRCSREKEWDQLETELKTLKKKVVDPKYQADTILGAKDNAKARGEIIGDILISLLMPAVNKVQNAADRAQQVQDNLVLAFALAWYQREHGRYPEKLDTLAPKYLATIPQDLFSGKALFYRPAANGYLLYSVGLNGKDDEGRGTEDNPPGDDLSVRMPLPELRGK